MGRTECPGTFPSVPLKKIYRRGGFIVPLLTSILSGVTGAIINNSISLKMAQKVWF
jgi:hypothetical protein